MEFINNFTIFFKESFIFIYNNLYIYNQYLLSIISHINKFLPLKLHHIFKKIKNLYFNPQI